MIGGYIGQPIGGVINIDTGALNITGNVTLDNATNSGAFANIESLTGSQTLAAATNSGSFANIEAITGNKTLASVSQSATLTVLVQASQSITLANATDNGTIAVIEAITQAATLANATNLGSISVEDDLEEGALLEDAIGRGSINNRGDAVAGGVIQPGGQFSRSRWRRITEEEARKKLEAQQEAEWKAERERVAWQLKRDTEKKNRIAARDARFANEDEQNHSDALARLGLSADRALVGARDFTGLDAHIRVADLMRHRADQDREEEEEMLMLLELA